MANIGTVIMTIQVLLFISECYPVPNSYFSLGMNYPTKHLFGKLLLPASGSHRTIQIPYNDERINFQDLLHIPLHKLKHPWILSRHEVGEVKTIDFNGQTFLSSTHKSNTQQNINKLSSDTVRTSYVDTRTLSTASTPTDELSTGRSENSDFKNLYTNVIIKSRVNVELTTEASLTKATTTTLTPEDITETTIEGETTASLDDVIETRVGPQVVASLLG